MLPFLKRLDGSFMSERFLRNVVIVQVGVALEGLLQCQGATEAVGGVNGHLF